MRLIAFRWISACVLIAVSFQVLRADCTVTCTATVPAAATAGESVSFESHGTPCSCAGAASYHWTFGDGGDSTAQNPSHAYSSPGTYSWQLDVTADSTTCTKSGSIVVGNGAPVAGTYSGTTSAGLAFSLTVNASSQITGWNVSYANVCSSTGSTGTSTTCSIVNGAFSCGSASCIPFSTQTSISGNFPSSTTVSGTVTIKVQPGLSTCCTQTPTFTASNGGGGAALTAAASSDVSSGDAPLTVNFTGSATGGTGPYTYSWNFGDCTATSSTQNPSHVYAAGNWYAVLTVTDSVAATDDAVVPIGAVPVGITVTPTSGLVTTEAGGTATFSVVLQSAPDNDVTIQLDTSDATEGRISTDGVTQQSTLTLTFTNSNWNTPQVVTVHGQNDPTVDGNISYTIDTAASVSSDPSYNGIDPLNVSATNNDDDVAGVTVTPTTATVLESGTTDDFTVVLNTQPSDDVVIDLSSTDTGEVTVSPAQLTFTNGDWSAPKTVTVTGVDDVVADGDQQTVVSLTINQVATLDPNYDSVDPADVTVTTTDDDTLSIVSTNPIANEKAAPRGSNVQATASASINAATVTQTTFHVQGEQTGRIAGLYSASGPTFQLNPTNDLKPGELIRVTATSGIQSAAAIPMTPRVWQFTAATSTSTGAMMKTSSFQAGSTANVALGDVDGDGDLDAIFANSNTAPEQVWKNDGTGAFTQFATFGNGDTYDVALGDLDGDGDLDAFAGNRLSDDTIWLNDGTGIFTLHDSVSSDWTQDVALGDLDRDGDLDAILATNPGAFTVWLNDGTGDFSAHPTTPLIGTSGADAVTLGDIDGDGDLDALAAQGGGPERVWLNDGAGAFSPHATPSFGDYSSLDIALGDLDGDADLDVVVANSSSQPEAVWLNNGSGVFALHGSFGIGDSRAVLLGDLDGDGDLDAVVGNADGNETIWLNDGTGTFAAHAAVPGIAGGDGWGLALGDLDGDGDLDAIAGDAGAGANETLWLNERIIVAPISGLTTTEAGGTSSFNVLLGRAPTADVTIHLATSDATEGRVSSDGVTQQDSLDLTFTTANWSTPRTITVHGQNDALSDWNIPYTIVLSAATSSDPFYSGVNPHDVTATNLDDEPFGTPSFLTATASGTTTVELTWGSVAGATAYEVYRTTSVAIDYALVTSVSGVSFTDTGRAPDTTYLYKVRAMDGATPSPYSPVDAATTTAFTDPTLTSTTKVKADHVTELRTAINALHIAANLGPVSFTDPTVTALTIKRVHVVELRTALDAARSAIGLSALTYTDSTITTGSTTIKAAHVSELRAGTQ